MTDLSAVTVTYNSSETIDRFLESLRKWLPQRSEAVIVDNASTDKTLQIIEGSRLFKEKKKNKLIKSKINLGFGRANNLAIKKASGEYLIFLNPDTEIVSGTIKKLLNFIRLHPDIGILAPQLILADGSIQPSVKRLPTLLGAIKEYYFGQKNAYEEYFPKGEKAVEVECAYGAGLMIKKDTFERLNGFDERYFLYYEDIDLCKRVREMGLKVVYYPQAQLKHVVGSSTKGIKSLRLPLGIRTIANFIPLKGSGSRFYQVVSENIYHGVIIATVIRVLIYIALKFALYKVRRSFADDRVYPLAT